MRLNEVVKKLAQNRIDFSCHYPASLEQDIWVIQINESLNNEQLKIAVSLGGNMGPNGVVMLIGEGY